MRYETPELTALTPAIDAIQFGPKTSTHTDSSNQDATVAYEDWES
jgi:hypothetical protein